MRNIYDNSEFFAAYAEMGRSKDGLKAAGEWHQLQPLFPKLQGKKVLDLGCGYGWHCKYAAQMGATEILGIDSSQKMIAKAVADNSDDKIKYNQMIEELAKQSDHTFELKAGTLYPLLHLLEQKQYLVSYDGETVAGKTRKYYRITDEGKRFLVVRLSEWESYSAAVNKVLSGGVLLAGI